jgi:hypothetical protein
MHFKKFFFTKSISDFYFPLLFSLFFLVSTFIDPLWFTNSKGYIDAWIYWGAGDNPRLSYQNDFASTYYLQRYVVIVPKILAFSLFGSFWGQLVVGLFWISIAFYFLLRISSRYIGRWSAFLLVLLFMSDPVLLGAFGSSYTMGPTIAFYSILFFLLLKISPTEEKNQNKRSILFLGVTVACLTNTYLLHGLIAFGICVLYIFFIKVFSVLEFLKYFLTSSVVVTALFQVIYFFISGNWVPFILRQLYFGLNLTSSSNSYGSEGFIDFWGNVLSSELNYYWLSIVICYIPLALYVAISRQFEFVKFRVLLLTSISLLLAYLSQTLLFTNIFGYIWLACGLYILKFLTLVFLVLILTQLFSNKATNAFISLALVLSLFIGYLPNLSASSQFNRFGFLTICILIILLIGSFLIPLITSLEAIRVLVGFSASLFLVLSTFSHGQDFRQYAVPFEGTFLEAKSYYGKLSSQRDIILLVSESINPTPRAWFKPDSGVPLISSQLFLYSLVSDTPEKSNCSQVDWASNYKSLIFHFGSKNLDNTEVTRLYLAECGYDVVGVSLSRELAKTLKDNGGQVWELIPKN